MDKIFSKNQHLFAIFAVLYSSANTGKEISYLVALQIEYLLLLRRRIFVCWSPTVDTTHVELVTQSQALSLFSSHLQYHCLSTTAYTHSYMYACVCPSSGGTGRKVWEVLNLICQSCGAILTPNSNSNTILYVSAVIHECMLASRALQRGCDSPFVTLYISQQR